MKLASSFSELREVRLIQTVFRKWGLLVMCGVLEAITSLTYFSHAIRGFESHAGIAFLGKLALAAGACTVAAGIWSPAKMNSWLLVLNGLALGALGLVLHGAFGFRIRFSTIAMLVIIMALSIAILELESAKILWRLHQSAEGWVLGVAGAISVVFALAFFVLGFGWISLEPGSHSDLIWLGAYFAFSACCMVGLVLEMQSGDLFRSGRRLCL